jgi:hypothetical protein
VLKCYSQRKRIPWRRFALDRKQKEEDESEDEILDERSKPSEIESRRESTGRQKFFFSSQPPSDYTYHV